MDLGWNAGICCCDRDAAHGKDYPFFALWNCSTLRPSALLKLQAIPRETGTLLIRRTKEEMVTFDETLYPKRNADTFSYDLTQAQLANKRSTTRRRISDTFTTGPSC